jgi:hypothetical protein
LCSNAAYLWLTQIWEKVALGTPTFVNAHPAGRAGDDLEADEDGLRGVGELAATHVHYYPH